MVDMAVYVDKLRHWGVVYRGKKVRSCHVMTDDPTCQELHELMEGMRAAAVKVGAIEVDMKTFSLTDASPQQVLVATAEFLRRLPKELQHECMEVIAANARVAEEATRYYGQLRTR